jgi:hypothetical protein
MTDSIPRNADVAEKALIVAEEKVSAKISGFLCNQRSTTFARYG